MSTITSLFEQAQLAEAAYADFWDDDLGSLIIDPDGVIAALQDVNNDGSFSESQATAFVADWSILTHQPDTASGYSSTLFQSKDDPNEYVLAFRGTAGAIDLVGADGGDIVLDGLAISQIVDMYNDWSRIQAGVGNTYTAATLVTLADETALLTIERAIMPLGIPGPYEIIPKH